jgi:hypothetical protein
MLNRVISFRALSGFCGRPKTPNPDLSKLYAVSYLPSLIFTYSILNFPDVHILASDLQLEKMSPNQGISGVRSYLFGVRSIG